MRKQRKGHPKFRNPVLILVLILINEDVFQTFTLLFYLLYSNTLGGTASENLFASLDLVDSKLGLSIYLFISQ